MSKSRRSLHIWTGYSPFRFWIPRTLQALLLQNVCLHRQHFIGTYATAGYWWIHWPLIRPNTKVAELTCFLSNRCISIVVPLSASLDKEESVNHCVTGSLKVRDWFLRYCWQNFTKVYNLTTFVFLCRERGKDHRERRRKENCDYCWTCDHFCPQDLKKGGFNS